MESKREKLITIFSKYNAQINLSAIRKPEEILVKHIQDALELEKIFQFEKGKTIADLGTGGWFPLLPLAMQHPNNRFTGIDARRKKVDAVNAMIDELWISNVKARWSRIEEYNDKFDYVMARAVAYIDILREWSQHLLRKGGKLILFKSASIEEKEDIETICINNALQIEIEHHYKLFDGDQERVIYVISN